MMLLKVVLYSMKIRKPRIDVVKSGFIQHEN